MDYKQLLARYLLGQGMAGKAADTQKLYPIYQKQQIDAQTSGQQLPPFEEWVKQYQPQPTIQSPVLPN